MTVCSFCFAFTPDHAAKRGHIIQQFVDIPFLNRINRCVGMAGSLCNDIPPAGQSTAFPAFWRAISATADFPMQYTVASTTVSMSSMVISSKTCHGTPARAP